MTTFRPINPLLINMLSYICRNNYYRAGPAASAACGAPCRKELLCRLVTSASGDASHCASRVEAPLEASSNRENSVWFDWWF